MKTLLFLTGFSGTGKSTVGRLVAQRLGFTHLDTDEIIVSKAGRSIPELFRAEGEDAFRALEREVLAQVAEREGAVVSTGGGIVLMAENRALMQRRGLIVALEARPETIEGRLRSQPGRSPEERPLLAGPDPLARIRELKASRQAAYAEAHWTIHTDALTVEEVAAEVLRAWERLARRPALEGRAEVAAVVHSSAGPYPVLVGWGLLARLGQELRGAGITGAAWVITDERIAPHYGEAVRSSLQGAELETDLLALPAGEASKSLATVARVYQWLVERRAERGHAIVALGGGVIGDLAGFVAATFLRGLPLIQVPTSLLAMADAAIGGKVAVNLAEGKNLVGAFYPPRLVLEDVATLTTLPQRERTEGWAEVLKHGLILDAPFLDLLEERAEALQALEPRSLVSAIARSAAIKSRVVSQDEEETTGLRALLNYGHTLGHALEAALGYGQLLHGEAVSVGMTVAAHLSQRLGLLSAEAVGRQHALLKRFGLPTLCPTVPWEALWAAISLDKKAQDRTLRWVLLEELGRVVLRADVPRELVQSVVEACMSPAADGLPPYRTVG